jgi:isopenicillin-N epimerase
LNSPPGSAFLYARRKVQYLLEPLVVSWGWQSDEYFTTGSTFVDNFQWRGTDDPSACLAVPSAIDFMRENDWESVQIRCHELLTQALERIASLTGLPHAYLDASGYYQMGVAQLPRQVDLRAFKRRLYEQYRIEIPCIEWDGRHWLRVSVQAYNSPEDINCLVAALGSLLNC